MREQWKLQTIGDLCAVVNGGTPKTNVPACWDGDHLWITPAEMGKRSSPYVSKTQRTLTDTGLGDSSARLLPPFSVVLSSRAPIGHLVINTEPMATNQGCKGLVPNKAINYKFLFYYLGSIVNLLNELGTGATFKELSGGKLKDVPIPVPPLPEQKRVVAILDEAFEGIAAAVTNAKKNLLNARGLFDSYLNSALAFTDGQVTQRQLVDLCEKRRIITYGVIKLGQEVFDGVSCLSTSNVRWLGIETDGIKRIAEALSREYKRTILQGGEILVNVRGTLGGVAVAKPEMVGWNVSREVAVVPADKTKVDSYYLAYWIGRKASQNWLTGVQRVWPIQG